MDYSDINVAATSIGGWRLGTLPINDSVNAIVIVTNYETTLTATANLNFTFTNTDGQSRTYSGTVTIVAGSTFQDSVGRTYYGTVMGDGGTYPQPSLSITNVTTFDVSY